MNELEARRDALLSRLSFDRQDDGTLARRGKRFRLDAPLDDASQWRTWAWSAWTCRIVVDQVTSDYDVATERAKKKARNVYEVASSYGDRERYLLPRSVAETVSALSGKRLASRAWVDDRFVIVLGLQEGLGVHFLGEDELDRIPFDEENVWENARLAHFYASYKARPVANEKLDEVGRIKHFHTVDARTASRAILLPDFDWDAAQDRGCCLIPSRDHLFIGEPFGEENAGAIDVETADRARAIAAPDLPFFPTLYRLGPKTVEPAADAWEDPYGAPPDRLPVSLLGD